MDCWRFVVCGGGGMKVAVGNASLLRVLKAVRNEL